MVLSVGSYVSYVAVVLLHLGSRRRYSVVTERFCLYVQDAEERKQHWFSQQGRRGQRLFRLSIFPSILQTGIKRSALAPAPVSR